MDVDTEIDIKGQESGNTSDGEGSNMECTSSSEQIRICLIGDIGKDSNTYKAAQKFKYPIIQSETGSELLKDESWETIFVLDDFSGPIYEEIQSAQQRILGSPALQQYAERGDVLPRNSRPLFNLAMLGLVICFTGFRKREELTRLVTLIHYMGGSIRKDMVSKITHLIANCCGGDKYQYAVTFRVPVMSESWVSSAWEQRKDLTMVASNETMMCHKLKPFFGARVCFYGFPADECQHMTDILLQNGGEPSTLDDFHCSHVVVDSGETYSLLKAKVVVPLSSKSRPPKTPALNSTSHQNCCDETDVHSLPSTPRSSQSKTLPWKPPEARVLTPGSTDMFLTAGCINVSTPKTTGQSSKSHFHSNRYDDNMDSDSLVDDPVRCKTPVSSRRVDCSALDNVFKTPISTPCRKTNLTPEQRRLATTTTSTVTNSTSSPYLTDLDLVSLRNDRNMNLNSVLCHRGSIPILEQKSNPTTDLRMKSKRSRRLSLGGLLSKASFLHLPKPNISKVETDSSVVTSNPNPNDTDQSSPMEFTQTVPWDNPPIMEEEVLELTKTPVVDESRVKEAPSEILRAPIVKAEWFWVSVQNEGCADERDYLFEDYLESQLSPSSRRASLDTTAFWHARKRKRLRDTVTRLVQNDSPVVHKRRSSVSDAGLLSMSGSFLDSTGDNLSTTTDEVEAVVSSDTPRKALSPRQQVFSELVQTESNYVGILHTIMMMFKSPLEEMTEVEGPLLNNTELKIIFGNLPPIYEIHRQMLDELKHAAKHWKEDVCIGKIFLKHAPDLVKAYPPFVNFFENTKEMLVKCDQLKPRFHAFLKICQTRPECGRQSLQELLIRPVQRLPSISLLLTDILKHTSKSNADHSYLEQALSGIREVMTHINEDKRKTEGQLVMFDIFNEIDNCPPHLVSSHRSFIVRCDVMELSDGLSGRGDNLAFFLFSDTMEVCKKRSRAFSMKSPNPTNSLPKLSNSKPYKHVRLVPLSNIKRVIDIRETDECHAVFALMCRSSQEMKEKLYSFTLADQETDKLAFLRTLCRQMANTVCKADAENFLTSLDSHQLDIDTSDVTLGTLSRAFKFASRTRLKIGRTFSFNKTPSNLKRAVSTMMSPFGSTMNLTPSSQLAQMRLASCANLHELGGGTPTKVDLVAPNTVQPTRKNKGSSQSLSVASLRRL